MISMPGNATIGLLWDAWAKDEKRLTIGWVLHTPFTADLSRETETTSILDEQVSHLCTHESIEMDFPLFTGLGLNYRFFRRLEHCSGRSMDDWSKFEQRDEKGHASSPLAEALLEKSLIPRQCGWGRNISSP